MLFFNTGLAFNRSDASDSSFPVSHRSLASNNWPPDAGSWLHSMWSSNSRPLVESHCLQAPNTRVYIKYSHWMHFMSILCGHKLRSFASVTVKGVPAMPCLWITFTQSTNGPQLKTPSLSLSSSIRDDNKFIFMNLWIGRGHDMSGHHDATWTPRKKTSHCTDIQLKRSQIFFFCWNFWKWKHFSCIFLIMWSPDIFLLRNLILKLLHKFFLPQNIFWIFTKHYSPPKIIILDQCISRTIVVTTQF